MTRGRKTGGINVNQLNDRDDITNKIINQINSLNKKIKAFKIEGIEEHASYIKHIISDDMGQFTGNDTLSKSKNFYKDKNTVWLKKTLSALIKINNHEYYGTTHKYHKEVTNQLKGVKNYAENYLKGKGYSQQFIFETTNSKDFFVKLFDAFGEGQKYGSDQIIDKIALDYGDTGYTEEEKNKILNNIEYSKNTKQRIQEEKNAFEEFKKSRNQKMR